jgi:hypothetical protein
MMPPVGNQKQWIKPITTTEQLTAENKNAETIYFSLFEQNRSTEPTMSIKR